MPLKTGRKARECTLVREQDDWSTAKKPGGGGRVDSQHPVCVL